MLIIDGVRYKPWIPKDEENDFHPMVRANASEIFGTDSVYFDVKFSLKSVSGIVSIPDAYVLNLRKTKAEWYVIENELATHPIYDHIVKQLTKFINGVENQNTRMQILDMIYQKINEDTILKSRIKKLTDADDTYHLLSRVFSMPPRIVIIIDQKTAELEEATRVLKYHTDIIEFKIFAREDDMDSRAVLFEPLNPEDSTIETNEPKSKNQSKNYGTATPQQEYAVPILETLIEMGGSGKASIVLSQVFEKMKNRLKEKDLETLPKGVVRWRDAANWERTRLKGQGYIKKGLPNGIWEITNEGRTYYQTSKSEF
ncbi:MAG: winged helix-turn-helix domain-containing protein [Candidatus Bathyarchaeia archaeon]|jgi:hypothetical protein